MGYTRHHAIICTSWSLARIAHASEVAEEIGLPVTAIHATPINSYSTFIVLPDGSKEGWTDSDDGDEMRERFIQYLRDKHTDEDGGHYIDWALVQYGDDYGNNCVLDHNSATLKNA